MEMINRFRESYGPGEDDRMVTLRTRELLQDGGEKYGTPDMLKRSVGLLDLTSLNTQDNDATARRLVRSVNLFAEEYPGFPNVAAICVYPTLVAEVKKELKVSGVRVASVGACFPSSQSFLSVKLAECELIVDRGADEIDVVIPVGEFLAGNCNRVMDELLLIREVTRRVHLKVILETGILQSAENIRLASLMALEAGADFIKTSTGKTQPAATHEAVYVMARAIRDFYSVTGKKAGLKPAGGIATVEDLIPYLMLVDHLLGEEWFNPGFFRIGASRLANELVSTVMGEERKPF